MLRAKRMREESTMSACSPPAASQGTPPSGRSDRSSVISVSPGGHLQRADLVAQPRRRLEVLALDRLLQLRAQRPEARVALEQRRIRNLVSPPDVLRAPVHPPQEVAEAVLKRAIAVRAAEAAARAEIAQRGAAIRAARRVAGKLERLLLHGFEEVTQRMLRHRNCGLDPALGGALLTQVELRHRILHDLREIQDRVPLVALVAKHQTAPSFPVLSPSLPSARRSTRAARAARERLCVTTTSPSAISSASSANRSCKPSAL